MSRRRDDSSDATGGEVQGSSKGPARAATIAHSSRLTPAVPLRVDSELNHSTTARPPAQRTELTDLDRESRQTEPGHHGGWDGSDGDGWSLSGAPTTPLSEVGVGMAVSGAAVQDAIEAVGRARPTAELDLVGEMEELFALDDWSGALKVAEFLLGRHHDHALALRCADQCRERLCAQYTSKLGALSAIVALRLNDAELRWLGLDHRAGFLLSRVDGESSLEELLDICGMPRLEALKTLVELQARGVIRVLGGGGESV